MGVEGISEFPDGDDPRLSEVTQTQAYLAISMGLDVWGRLAGSGRLAQVGSVYSGESIACSREWYCKRDDAHAVEVADTLRRAK